jgi:hypothetical protein
MHSLKEKRVLIISNNTLSTQNNNGKTLLSFFNFLPRKKIAQLYFSDEPADQNLASQYYKISDQEIIKSLTFWKKDLVKKNISDSECVFPLPQQKALSLEAASFRRFELARILREIAWKVSRIEVEQLKEWVKDFDPEVIFFCAGDSAFAYRFYDLVVSEAPAAKKAVYVTDDYILPRIKLSPFWWLRRNIIYTRMKRAALNSDVFFTISQEMRDEYRKRFGKDSTTIFNASTNMRIDGFQKTSRKDLQLVYAGGLHFNRWKTLNLLALSIKKFNEEKKRSIKLKIYSHQTLDKTVLQALEVPEASEYCGPLDADGVRHQLNDADILVHVESFSRKCIESTRLSISTKIAEYLSTDSRILAIGPENVASMRFLKDNAACVTSIDTLENSVFSILESDEEFDNSEIMASLAAAQDVFYSQVLS